MTTAFATRAPRHGEVRHHGIRSLTGAEIALVLPSGSIARALVPPGIGACESVSETYCAHCRRWIETNGVMGPLNFMAFHRDGDCQTHDIPPVLRSIRMPELTLNDRVKHADADDPRSIPAYRTMRGHVFAVGENGRVKVAWGPKGSLGIDEHYRDPSTVVHADD